MGVVRRKRAESAPQRAGNVPAPLTSRLHPVWEHPSEVLALAKALHLHLDDSAQQRATHGPLAAFEAVSRAYIAANGPSPAIPMFTFGMATLQRHNMHEHSVTPDEWKWIAETERHHGTGPTDAMIADKLTSERLHAVPVQP